jgi:hypothetical protein
MLAAGTVTEGVNLGSVTFSEKGGWAMSRTLLQQPVSSQIEMLQGARISTKMMERVLETGLDGSFLCLLNNVQKVIYSLYQLVLFGFELHFSGS